VADNAPLPEHTGPFFAAVSIIAQEAGEVVPELLMRNIDTA
jgi:hypothetical protein